MDTLTTEKIKNLPDETKAQIAKMILQSARKSSESQVEFHLPVLKLLKHSTASNLTVEFQRVSSDGQKDGFSLPAQKEKAQEYMKQHGLNCVQGWSVTESASKEFDRRKFFEMIRYVSENGIKNVVFDKIDRACRGLRAAVMIEDLVEAGVRFHFTRDNLIVDKDSAPSDKLRFYLGVVLAKFYIDNMKSDILKGMDKRWDDGYWNGRAPVGYRNHRDDSRAWIEVDKVVAPFVQQIFELYATGNYSYKALEKHLAGKVTVDRKVRVEKEGKIVREVQALPINHKCIESLICNPFYYGARRYKGEVVFNGKEKHTPLITKELFDACQKIKGIRAQNTHISLAHEIQKPFMSLMKCGVCGHVVTGEVHKKASGKIYVYYHCANQSCHQRRINVRQESILTQLKIAFEPFARLTMKATASFIEGVKEQIEQLDVYASERRQELVTEKATLEQRCEELRQLTQTGKLSEAEAGELLARKHQQLHERDVEIEAHTTASRKTFIAGLKVIELLGKSSQFMSLEGNELNKARLARMVLSNPILKDGNLEYHYEKPFDELVFLTSHRNWWRWRESNPRPKSFNTAGLHV